MNMDYGCYTLSYRFPTMNINNDATTSQLSPRETMNTHPNASTDRRKKIILPSLSNELPARIYRKSNRLQLDKLNKNSTKALNEPLFIQINESGANIDDNIDSSFLSGSGRGNVLLRTITHSEKFSRKKQQRKPLPLVKRLSSSGMATIPTTTFFGDRTTADDIFKNNTHPVTKTTEQLSLSMNKPRITSAQKLLHSLDVKRMTNAEKVKKWLTTHCVTPATDSNNNSKDQDIK